MVTGATSPAALCCCLLDMSVGDYPTGKVDIWPVQNHYRSLWVEISLRSRAYSDFHRPESSNDILLECLVACWVNFIACLA